MSRRAFVLNLAGRFGMRILQTVNVVCLAHLFRSHVGQISGMDGPSMLPTLAEDGDWVVENSWSYRRHPESIARGELITFQSPIHSSRVVCKRVIGLPGDVICVDPTGSMAPSTEHVIVPKDHVWVMGDNAAYSRDSRLYGPLSTALIRGRVIGRVWPWTEAGWFKNPITRLGKT